VSGVNGVRLLLSAAALAAHGQALARIAAEAGRALQPVLLEDAADDPAAQVHIAWITRDVTGLSTKHVVIEPLAGCYRVLRRSPGLAWVHTHSAGLDRPIYPELMARGVAVTASLGANADVVAQTALGAVLALARRFPQLMAAQAQRRWAPLVAGPLPPDLAGQQVVLVGWGAIARRLQPWLAMLGLKVSVVRRCAEPAGPGIDTLRYADLPRVLPAAQWLVLACPLSDETRRLVDAAALAALPTGAMLVNVARGEVVDQAALIDALRRGHLGGAYLDVFETEPLAPESPLWTLPNVVVTPHSAGQSAGHATRTAALFLDNLRRWLADEPLRHQASPADAP
jgi:D-2-hydroxyacid dehydrogenase (NADP+)